MNVEDHDVLRTTRQTHLRGGEQRDEESALQGFEVRQSHDSRLRRGRGPGGSPERGGQDAAQTPGYQMAVYNQLDPNVLDQHRQVAELDDMQSVDNDNRERP